MDTDTVREFTRLAGEYAPFFFAVLFLTIITRLAQRYYYLACSRTDPAASETEQRTYRLYFLSIAFSSIVLVLLAIGWFMYNQTRGGHVYQIAITELDSTIRVEAPYFAKTSLRPSFDNSAISDVFFLIVQDQPFVSGTKFAFTVWIITPNEPSAAASRFVCGGAGTPVKKSIEIIYKGKKQEHFRLQLQPGGEPKLVALDATHTTSYFSPAEIRRASQTFPRIATIQGHAGAIQ